MKSTVFYSNMRMTVKLSIFIWLLTLKSVNGFGYVNQSEVKSQYRGCLNICVKLCKAFGETRLEFKSSIFKCAAAVWLKSSVSGPWYWVIGLGSLVLGPDESEVRNRSNQVLVWLQTFSCRLGWKLIFNSVKVNFVLIAIR